MEDTSACQASVRDIDFDNEFVNLTETSEIKDKSTVKVIYLPDETVTLTLTTVPQGEDDFLLSSASDTDIFLR